jgi:hypothetical protein
MPQRGLSTRQRADDVSESPDFDQRRHFRSDVGDVHRE